MDDNLAVSGETSGWIFFCIFIYALFTSSLLIFLLISKFKILYASETDIDDTLLVPAWLKEKLPDLLNVWISLKREINWKIDKPFNFNKAKLAKVRGKVNKNFPPIANKTARAINPNIIRNLRPFEIFLDEMLVIKRNRK